MSSQGDEDVSLWDRVKGFINKERLDEEMRLLFITFKSRNSGRLITISCLKTTGIRGTALPNDEPEQERGWRRFRALFEIRYVEIKQSNKLLETLVMQWKPG